MQEFFFTKVAPIQNITDIVLLDFWLMLVSWMFVSPYTTTYFSVKKFIFSNVYISVNTVFECLYMVFGWERGHQLCTYAAVEGMGGSFKLCTVADRVMGCHASCVCTNIWTFQIVIAKNLNITCIFNQRNSFNRLTHSSLSSIFEFLYKSGIQMFV